MATKIRFKHPHRSVDAIRFLPAVEAKEDYPCAIPDVVWRRICGDRRLTLDFVCTVVRMVKENIKERMMSL